MRSSESNDGGAGFGLARPYISGMLVTCGIPFAAAKTITLSGVQRALVAGRATLRGDSVYRESHLPLETVHLVVLEHRQLAVLSHPARKLGLVLLDRVCKVVLVAGSTVKWPVRLWAPRRKIPRFSGSASFAPQGYRF